jgi:glycerol 3-phosphatase-2
VLAGCARPLAAAYDAGLLDLDGVVYRGQEPLPGAPAAVVAARAAGMRVGFVTNNATRTPERVAEHLRALGIDARPADVVTAPQAAVRLLRERVAPGSRVLVVGAEGLLEPVAAAGFAVVRSATERPQAVVQGLAPGITYDDLAEVALALRGGIPWVATNLDATLPTERGLQPGNGAYVALLRTATGREPDVAGKPFPALFEESVTRLAARRALVVGDRLDTDVAGAVAAGCDSLHVLSGAHRPADLAAAPPGMRPTYLGAGLAALLRPAPAVERGEWTGCGGWRARVAGGVVELAGGGSPSDDGLDRLRAVLAAAWARVDAGEPVPALPEALLDPS